MTAAREAPDDREEKFFRLIAFHAGPWVYAIRCGDFVKIGTTRNVRKRLTELQMGNPWVLTLIAAVQGGREREREFHAALAEEGVERCGEWFRLSGRYRPLRLGLEDAADAEFERLMESIDA
jgi:hypothetical protein